MQIPVELITPPRSWNDIHILPFDRHVSTPSVTARRFLAALDYYDACSQTSKSASQAFAMLGQIFI